MNVESRVLSVESPNQRFGLRSHSSPQPSTLNSRPSPRGVTLIELLITIMIISILAAAVLGVAAVAGETAREAKTRTIIFRLHTLLMEHYDTYANRRVKLRPQVLTAINSVGGTTAAKGKLKAEARLYALREMMLMEVPDRWSDVLLNSVANGAVLSPIYLDVTNSSNGRTELANVYLRIFNRIRNANNKLHPGTNTVADLLENQGAECLYMVIMNATGDGEARTLFPASSIGDTDGDGAPEFLDGWGRPIEFVRWAPGFVSDIQSNSNELDNPATGTLATAWINAGSADHDPFDLYRAHPVAFRLVPLIYSAGRDEESGLVNDPSFVTWKNPNVANAAITGGNVSPSLNPYGQGGATFPSQYFGTAVDRSTATDNIHNHLIGTR